MNLRETCTKFSSTFQKGGKTGKIKNGGKLGDVGKYIVKMNDLKIIFIVCLLYGIIISKSQ